MNGVDDHFEEANKQKSSFLVKAWMIVAFIFLDLLLSTTADYDPPSLIGDIFPVIQTAAQLLLLICLTIMFFLMISATYPFRVGLLSALGPELRFLEVALISYWVIFLVYAGVKIPAVLQIDGEVRVRDLYDSTAFGIVSLVQKLGALVLYAGSIDGLLRLGEPRFYEQGEWTRNASVKRALAKVKEARMSGHAAPL